MINPQAFDELVKRISALVPPDLRQAQQSFEKTVHALVQTWFAKLNLVSREEFDVQTAVLAKTRAKLEELSKQIATLEAQVFPNKSTH